MSMLISKLAISQPDIYWGVGFSASHPSQFGKVKFINGMIGVDIVRNLSSEIRVSFGNTEEFGLFSHGGLYIRPDYAISDYRVYGLIGYGQNSMGGGGSYAGTGYIRERDKYHAAWGIGIGEKQSDGHSVSIEYLVMQSDNLHLYGLGIRIDF